MTQGDAMLTEMERWKLRRQVALYRTIGILCISASVVMAVIFTLTAPYLWYQKVWVWVGLAAIARFPWHRLL